MFYEYHTRKLIETIKVMRSFDDICHNDRLIMVKNSGIEILILRGVFRYDMNAEAWKYPTVKMILINDQFIMLIINIVNHLAH